MRGSMLPIFARFTEKALPSFYGVQRRPHSPRRPSLDSEGTSSIHPARDDYSGTYDRNRAPLGLKVFLTNGTSDTAAIRRRAYTEALRSMRTWSSASSGLPVPPSLGLPMAALIASGFTMFVLASRILGGKASVEGCLYTIHFQSPSLL